MPTPLDGLPEPLAAVDLGQGFVQLEIDSGTYPLDALYGAAYVFIDRAYVLLDKPAEQRFRVTLSPKDGATNEPALRALAGEFANELLSCAYRHRLTLDNRALIESVTTQAVAGAMGPPSLDDLARFDFTDAPLDDPLGIAVSWEEKYQKKTPP